jgi:hypothetical protein
VTAAGYDTEDARLEESLDEIFARLDELERRVDLLKHACEGLVEAIGLAAVAIGSQT